MKTFSAVLLIATGLTAHARLGWTLAECEAKYGPASFVPATGKVFKTSAREAIFQFQGWRIRVAWFPTVDRAQFVAYQAPQVMTEAQFQAVLDANSDGMKWTFKPNSTNPEGTAIASALSGADMRSGCFVREDNARTGTIMLWAINNVEIFSAWLHATIERDKRAEEQKKAAVPDL